MVPKTFGTADITRDFLYGLLYGQNPVFEFNTRKENMTWMRLLCQLHRKIGADEMVKHRMLTPDFSRQETTFSSGAKITVDFLERSYQIRGAGKELDGGKSNVRLASNVFSQF